MTATSNPAYFAISLTPMANIARLAERFKGAISRVSDPARSSRDMDMEEMLGHFRALGTDLFSGIRGRYQLRSFS
jgi:hypothetical protein